MTTKKKGIIILAIIFLVLVVTTTVCCFKYADMKETITTLQAQKDCTEHEKTIARLQTEINELRDKAEGLESNTETNISEQALFFLNSFYSDNQAQNLKPLMTENAYEELFSSTTVLEYQTSSSYKVSFSNENVYYQKLSDTEADVLILADFNVDSPSGVTSSPFIFHIRMEYKGGAWLVYDILQNSTLQYGY